MGCLSEADVTPKEKEIRALKFGWFKIFIGFTVPDIIKVYPRDRDIFSAYRVAKEQFAITHSASQCMRLTFVLFLRIKQRAGDRSRGAACGDRSRQLYIFF